jgi:hypothetical protein
VFSQNVLDNPLCIGYLLGMALTDTPALSDLLPDDDYPGPTDADWEWYWEQMHDDYAENVMW